MRRYNHDPTIFSNLLVSLAEGRAPLKGLDEGENGSRDVMMLIPY
jgi:hypothetical protein